MSDKKSAVAVSGSTPSRTNATDQDLKEVLEKIAQADDLELDLKS